jgi:hypothetical protein
VSAHGTMTSPAANMAGRPPPPGAASRAEAGGRLRAEMDQLLREVLALSPDWSVLVQDWVSTPLPKVAWEGGRRHVLARCRGHSTPLTMPPEASS